MAEEKKKSQVDDINRSIYDIKDKVEYSYKADNGLTEEVIREISAKKEEPEKERARWRPPGRRYLERGYPKVPRRQPSTVTAARDAAASV